ncbi:MAG: hypothetical protein H0U40_01555 [Chloroflexia bacterium]|nr:hypothetical protein [Chloroflexia bacterium]MDQ3514928.1 hypothetical protein [Chloroflexota bacterium]
MRAVRRFWQWYERHDRLTVGITLGLFLLQLVHLYWLTTDVVWFRLTGDRLLSLDGFFEYVVLLVDYTEIPALITTSLVYLNDLRKGFTWKSLVFLLFLNSQWLHIYWITDEFVVNASTGNTSLVDGWLAWVAIGIDYLELPVIVDLARRFLLSWRRGTVGTFLQHDLRS